jgi:hypothetical protein
MVGGVTMSQITVDAALRARLNGLEEEITVRDESGKVLGRFVPESGEAKRIVMRPEDKCPYSPGELARMRSETGGRTLREIWQHLGNS